MVFIRLENVSKTFHKQQLLTDVSLNIRQHSITALEGVNGSGKTLILKSILGLVRVSGRVIINDSIINENDRYPLEAGILIENPSVLDEFSAHQNLKLVADLIDGVTDSDIFKILAQFELPIDKKAKVKNFSLGMKQKLGIAQAMLGQSELIVLDEPTNALDEYSINQLVFYIKKFNELGSTFIITSHDSSFIEKIATCRIKIKAGRVE